MTFYNDLPKDQQAHWMSRLKPHAYSIFTEKAPPVKWENLDITYLHCENDNALPMMAQEKFVAVAKEGGSVVEVERCAASHSPFLSMPEYTVEFLKKSIVGFQGKSANETKNWSAGWTEGNLPKAWDGLDSAPV